ncbi:MAG: hypothetical protein HYY06_19355 [Deltaproteobacteria bacterium]|nr:hypothetical protein [Deltaproteobacteria bacterium]
MKRTIGVLCFLALTVLSGLALAQDSNTPPADQAGGAGRRGGGRRGGQRIIRLEEITIEGRIQKPNAFFVLQRSNLGFAVLDLRTSFVQEIVRSVGRDPF